MIWIDCGDVSFYPLLQGTIFVMLYLLLMYDNEKMMINLLK